jgi:gamma-glutamylcyclotransferase (GGCT)/AIG2-like uncharacterized protein YtfP
MEKVDRSNLFVYGTLKKSGRLHNVLGSSSEFLGVFKTTHNNFNMYDYGCPVMVLEHDGFKIKGELYSVTSECMTRVTSVEVGAGYVPFIVEVNEDNYSEGDPLKAIAFLYPTPYIAKNISNNVKEKDRAKEWDND